MRLQHAWGQALRAPRRVALVIGGLGLNAAATREFLASIGGQDIAELED